MAETPEITVLMPAYNAARWLPEAVRSVLSQQGPSFELLIVDDGSSDDTPAVLASLRDARVRCLRQPSNMGLIAALERGLAEARGAFVARLDADDVCKPERLARQHAALTGDAGAIMVSGFSQLISEQGQHIAWSRWRFTPESYFYLLHFRNCIGHSTVMFRRDAALAAGSYRAAYQRAEDFDLWGRLSQRGKILCLPRELVAYRVHGASVSVREAEAQAEMAARIARERLEALLGEAVAPALGSLYSERAFRDAKSGQLAEAGAQFVRALEAIWRARPDYCDGPTLRRFIAVEWTRRALSFARRGVRLALPRHGLAPTHTLPEGALRGLLDEVPLPWIANALPRTHP